MSAEGRIEIAGLVVVGFGRLGGAVAEGAIRQRLVHPRSVLAIDPEPARRSHAERLGCSTAEAFGRVPPAAPVLISVKPQIWPEVAPKLAEALPPRDDATPPPVVVSVMAGHSIADISAALEGRAIVARAMPNTPARLGLAITALAWPDGISEEGREPVRSLLKSVGKVVELPESLFHAVTAVSGSGPAYIFKFAEGMEQAAIDLGIPPAVARHLVANTIRGAGEMLVEEGAEPGELRDAVTSRGGTTAAALEQFERWGLDPAVTDAIRAAEARSRELGGDPAPPAAT